MDDLFNNLFDIFTREVVATYDLQTARRHRNSSIPEFSTNQNILNNARIIRQEFENRYNGVGVSTPYDETGVQGAGWQDTLPTNQFRGESTRQQQSDGEWHRPGNVNSLDSTGTLPLNDFVRGTEWISTVTENLMSSFRDMIDNLENDFNLNSDFEDFEDVKVTLTESQFNNAVHTITNISDDDTCNICLDMLNNKEDNGIPVSLKCNHTFHNNCIKEWLTKKSIKCPMCRYECERN